MFYILSLTHTMKHDKYITLWRPNNSGYCYSKEMAGQYDKPEKGYHDSEDNMPIHDFEADRLFLKLPYDGELRNMIPNAPAVWEALKVKMTRNGLRRLV